MLDDDLAVVQRLGERQLVAGELAINHVQGLGRRGVHKQSIERVQIFITDRAVDRPVGRQLLAGAQNLFGDDREPPGERP